MYRKVAGEYREAIIQTRKVLNGKYGDSVWTPKTDPYIILLNNQTIADSLPNSPEGINTNPDKVKNRALKEVGSLFPRSKTTEPLESIEHGNNGELLYITFELGESSYIGEEKRALDEAVRNVCPIAMHHLIPLILPIAKILDVTIAPDALESTASHIGRLTQQDLVEFEAPFTSIRRGR